MEAEMVHKFETAGLGKAPYKFCGVTTHKFQAAPGEPIKPGASCDFCGASIMFAAQLEGACGSRFKVGCDCVLSAGDKGMRVKVEAWQKKHERELRAARKVAKAAVMRARFAELLVELEGMSERPGFQGMFAKSVAGQIKAGSAPSPKQMALIERFRSE
jgi:hypothetical protein